MFCRDAAHLYFSDCTVRSSGKQRENFNVCPGNMSYSGLGSKGDKPAKGKFTSININNLYRGKSVETPKAAGTCMCTVLFCVYGETFQNYKADENKTLQCPI